MVTRRGAIAFGVAAAFILSTSLLAQNDRKTREAQRREAQAVYKILESIEAGQPAPNELSVEWAREDLLKAQDNKQYVPFTITLDPSKVNGRTVSLYWRVVDKTPAPPSEKADPKVDPKKAPAYAYEDINITTLPGGQKGQARISRSFAVPGDSYDVYVVVKEPTPEKAQRNAPPLKVSVIKRTVEVPDLWTDELNTSSVFVAERIDPLPAPLTPEQQAERPYALGGMELTPVLDTKFNKSAELSTFLLIYNTKTDSANKPDITIEYNFYTKAEGAEKFFNKTTPQNLNAQTLPPQFDMAAGHQLQSGQAVPLASFPEGEYRLEIKVTDKLANKSLTRNVNFTVSGS